MKSYIGNLARAFLGVGVITFAAIQLIHESKLLISVVLDNAEDESSSR